MKTWFDGHHLHAGLEHEHYYGGIVVISATEKVKITMQRADGVRYIAEIEQAVYVPYVKVDTRIAYFWDYVRALNAQAEAGEEFYGSIRPASDVERIDNQQSAYYNAHLPPGFSIYAVKQAENNVSRYLVATFEAAIFRRGRDGKPDQVILRGRGSKQVAQKRQFPDDNAVMKAETGAIGRALGVAGILVVGTGVATAEDMQEELTKNVRGDTSAPAGPSLPDDVAEQDSISELSLGADVPEAAIKVEEMGDKLPETDEELRELATGLRNEMSANYPDLWSAYIEWWTGRFADKKLEELDGPALRGAVIKLQRDLDTAKQGGASS